MKVTGTVAHPRDLGIVVFGLTRLAAGWDTYSFGVDIVVGIAAMRRQSCRVNRSIKLIVEYAW